jgi:hypothetical protein
MKDCWICHPKLNLARKSKVERTGSIRVGMRLTVPVRAAGKAKAEAVKAQLPEGYASTTETADYLLAQLGLVRRAADAEAWPGGLRLLSRGGRSGFEVLGFEGTSPEDHMRHLRNIGTLLRRVQSPGGLH